MKIKVMLFILCMLLGQSSFAYQPLYQAPAYAEQPGHQQPLQQPEPQQIDLSSNRLTYQFDRWRKPASIGLIVVATPVVSYGLIKIFGSQYFALSGVGKAAHQAIKVLMESYPNISQNTIVFLGVLSANAISAWHMIYKS